MGDDRRHILPVAATFNGVPPRAGQCSLVEDGAVGTEEGPARALVVVAANVEDLAFGFFVRVVT